MNRKWMQAASLLLALLLLAAMSLPAALLQRAAHAERLTTPTDLAEQPTSGRRSGYAIIHSGSTVWTSRQRTSSVGKVTADSYVWIPDTAVSSLTYKIRFDTSLSTALDECHTAYVLSKNVTWLSDAQCEALEEKLEKQEARRAGGVCIPVIAFDYRNPPATPQVTATPEPTPAPATQAPAAATPAAQVTPKPTQSIITGTDLITPAPEQDVTTGTDLLPPQTGEEMTTPTDLTTPAPSGPLTEAEMRAALDASHPERQVSIHVSCTDPGFSEGSRMTMWADATGYEGLDYKIVWEVNRGDGKGWINAGIDGLQSLSFIISETNLHWQWRAGVSMPYIERK